MPSAEVSTMPADVIPLERGPRSHFTTSIGMILFLASWGITFGGLFVGYAIVRWRAPQWPPPGTPHLPHLLPSINTAVAFVSSFAFDRSVRAARLGRPNVVRAWLLLAGVLGTAFLLLQNMVWTQLWDAGLRLGTNNYAGMFYSLTWFHAAHVLVGLLMLVALLPRALRAGFTPREHLPLRLGAWFWHFVTGAWVGVFLAFYVL
jgi:heme/copper-type cytochrome/quinol oxidase subunit 3